MSLVRGSALITVLSALLLVACASNSADRSARSGRLAPVATPRPAGPTPFNPRAFDLYFPIEIAHGTGPLCGGREDLKLAARIDPVVERSQGIWLLKGCIASPGNVIYDVSLTLDFPDGETLAFSVLDQTERDREARFTVEVRRPSIGGAKGMIYCNQIPR